MKNKIKLFTLLLALAAGFLWSCDEDYEAPTAEPNHLYVTTSFGGQTNRLQVNSQMTFIDLSRGVQSRLWQFDEGVTDTAYTPISTATEQSVKVRFTTVGDHYVKLSQTYAGNVYIGEELMQTNTIDTTIMVTVVDSVRASFTASRNEDQSALTIADSTLNEIIAGREVTFNFEGTGDPSDFVWTIIREDGFETTVNGNPALVKFSSLGTYSIRLNAWSELGGDAITVEKLIKVIPSSDPVDLMDVRIDKRDEIRLTFSRDMQNPFNCPVEAFTLKVENKGSEIPVNITGFSLDEQQNNIVIIQLDQPLYNSDQVSLSYDDAVGNLATVDFMAATSFDIPQILFVNENIMDDQGYDVGFETSDISNWPYGGWGAPWDKFTHEITAAKAHSGSKSMMIEMQPEGGAIFDFRKDGTPVKFSVEKKVYEVGFWVYVEQLGNAETANGWIPDFRFYPNDWSAELFYGFGPDFKTGEWVFIKAEWNSAKAGDFFFFIRGYNGSSTVPHKMYIDDLTIYEKEVR